MFTGCDLGSRLDRLASVALAVSTRCLRLDRDERKQLVGVRLKLLASAAAERVDRNATVGEPLLVGDILDELGGGLSSLTCSEGLFGSLSAGDEPLGLGLVRVFDLGELLRGGLVFLGPLLVLARERLPLVDFRRQVGSLRCLGSLNRRRFDSRVSDDGIGHDVVPRFGVVCCRPFRGHARLCGTIHPAISPGPVNLWSRHTSVGPSSPWSRTISRSV